MAIFSIHKQWVPGSFFLWLGQEANLYHTSVQLVYTVPLIFMLYNWYMLYN